MANVIDLVTKYLPVLDEQYRLASKSAILDTPAEFIRETENAKKFKIAKQTTDGLANYSRNSGFVSGSSTLTWEEKEYSIDRGRALSMDAMDNTETFGLAFGRLAGTFQRDHVIPEMDAIRFSKYYKGAGITKAIDLTTDNVLAIIDDIIAEQDDAEVPEEGKIIFVSPTVYKLIMNDKNMTHFICADDDMSKRLNKKVYSYNDNLIIKVPSTRFYTDITLYDGTTSGQEAGGYAAASGAKNISMLIIAPSAVAQASKRLVTRFWAPTKAEMLANNADGVNPDADAWKFDYRTYHDAWILDNKTKGVAAVASAS